MGGEADLSDAQSHFDILEPVTEGQNSVSGWLISEGQNSKCQGSLNFKALLYIVSNKPFILEKLINMKKIKLIDSCVR